MLHLVLKSVDVVILFVKLILVVLVPLLNPDCQLVSHLLVFGTLLHQLSFLFPELVSLVFENLYLLLK